MLLSVQKCTYKFFKSCKQEALNRKSEQGLVDTYLAFIRVHIYTEVRVQADIQIPIDAYMQVNKVMIDLDAKGFAVGVNAIEGLVVQEKSFEFY